ncbi:TlpA family protein disulfide reductase [Microvirga sp. STR05]|uniref:TlpA family protein disulfide reductase n=1 Tax=Hymenobacter duratus TaxID=2771356 RepID=A0ABR8JNS4_9BACT|nr:TlpA disulfide reductase family protein [Hymenobacter duratus]MBD2717273.1 TlpA family protein disulfide reductase [Hymenobacter duratus]MBR7952193.1 TlpA family protein disulfide reductase [Microvirga sp. STR05]
MKYLYPLALSLLISTTALAQTGTAPAAAPSQQPKIRLTEQSVVTDAGGTRLPYMVWRQMVATGEYKLTPAPDYSPSAPTFRVVSQTAEERARQLARLPAPAPSPFFTTGQELPAFKLRDLQGRKYDSKELAGKIVVLNFWFINCGPCRLEIPELNKLVQHYAQRDDVVFLAVALDERAAVQAFVEKRPYDYALVTDGRYIAERYGVKSFPTNLVLDRQGKVVFHAQYHPNMAAYLQQAIEEAK